jgi:signal transduction histidine kinase
MSSHTQSGSLAREVLDALPLSTATLDRDGVIVDTNRAWREFAAENGITESQDHVGVSYLAVTEAATRKAEDGDAERAATGIRSVLSGDCERFTMEYPCHSPTERRWFRLLAAPLTTCDGRFVVVAHDDVTDRVLAERRAERQRDEMVEEREQLSLVNQILRHDVRNDLNLVTGWLSLLEKHVDPEGEGALRRVRKAAGHTLELVEAAGDFAELVDESRDPLVPTDVSAILASEVEKLRAEYEDRPTPLTVAGPESRDPGVEVLATPLLSSVFSNLLNNAVFHNDKAHVRIEATLDEREETVVVRVADNGPGIPDDRKERLFDQGEKRAESSGLGLGLYLVETLVRFYGGSVWVEDADPEGAVFCVELRRP